MTREEIDNWFHAVSLALIVAENKDNSELNRPDYFGASFDLPDIKEMVFNYLDMCDS